MVVKTMMIDLSKFSLQQVARRRASTGTTDEMNFERVGVEGKLKILTNIFIRNNTNPWGEVWIGVGDKAGVIDSNDSNRIVVDSGILTPRSQGQTVGYFTKNCFVPFKSWINVNYRNITLNDVIAAVFKYFEEI